MEELTNKIIAKIHDRAYVEIKNEELPYMSSFELGMARSAMNSIICLLTDRQKKLVEKMLT